MENEVIMKDNIRNDNQFMNVQKLQDAESDSEIIINSKSKLNGDHINNDIQHIKNDEELSSSSTDTGQLIIDQDMLPDDNVNQQDRLSQEQQHSSQLRIKTPSISLKRKIVENVENILTSQKTFTDHHQLQLNPMKYKKMIISTSSFLPEPDLVPPANLFNDQNDLLTTTVTLPPPPLPPIITNRSNINPFAFGHPEDVKQFLKQQIKFNKRISGSNKLLIKDKRKIIDGHINEYAQYLGLQPAVKFKCFKCSESHFQTLSELKEHQINCLIKCDSINNVTNIQNNINNQYLNNSLRQESITTNSNINSVKKKLNSDPGTKIRITRKVFLCSTCGTYYENWNLFLHMREVHKRHICLFCLGLFPTAEKLLLHLENKHNIIEKNYLNKDELLLSYKDSLYLMCCICEHVFTELDNFHDHQCETYLQSCIYCGLKSIHKPNCNGNLIGINRGMTSALPNTCTVTTSVAAPPLTTNSSSPTTTTTTTSTKQQQYIQKEIKEKIYNKTTIKQNRINFNFNSLPDYNEIYDDCNNVGDNSGNISVISNGDCKRKLNDINFENEFYVNVEQKEKNLNCVNNNHDNLNNLTTYKTALADNFLNDIHPPSDQNTNVLNLNVIENEKYKHKMLNEKCSGMEEHPNILQQEIIPIDGEKEKTVEDLTKTTCESFKTIINAENTSKDVVENDYLSDEESIINNIDDGINDDDNDVDDDDDDNNDDDDDDGDGDADVDGDVDGDDSAKDDNNCFSSEIYFPKIIVNDNVDDLNMSENFEKRLLVPKLKVKIPKQFTPIESEESSTESDDEQDLSNIQLDDENGEKDDDVEEEEYNDGNVEEDANEEEQRSQEQEQQSDNNDETNDETSESHINKEDLERNDDNKKEERKEEEENDEKLLEEKNFVKEEEEKENNDEKEIQSSEIVQDNIDATLTYDETLLENKYLNDEGKKENIDKVDNFNEISDGIQMAGDDIFTIELILDQPLDKIEIKDFIRICLLSTYQICLYCNHARRIACNGKSLALHFISQHKFTAIVNSITAEELQPSTIVTRLKFYLNDLDDIYFNLDTYDSQDSTLLPPKQKIFECFQCRFITQVHKELYLHNRKMHLKTILLCIMCKSNFYSYSELICHICPGVYNKIMIFDIKFRCCICNLDNIQSAFRLMVHLRKKHYACDVCLEECLDQSRLSNHVWKHKLHHLCYRCGIAYRNKPDITKHLFWKHGTESVLCKRCLQKKWPHVYHFCIPPTVFICEVCTLTFSKAVTLKVHKRLHSGDEPYPCTEDNCEKKFISRKLLLKHVARHSISIPLQSLIPSLLTQSSVIDVKSSKDFIKDEDCRNYSDCNDLEIKPKMLNESHNTITDETNTTTVNIKNDDVKKVKKKKSSKSKKDSGKEQIDKTNKNVIDIMDLPVPNLSESDSSDDDLNQTAYSMDMSKSINYDKMPVENIILDEREYEEDIKPLPLNDIWDNFKSYQASQTQQHQLIQEDGIDEDIELNLAANPIILHVCQSDHDYPKMYPDLIITKREKELEERFNEKKNNKNIKIEKIKTISEHTSSSNIKTKKEQKSPKKIHNSKSGSDDSSSSDSSSESDSCSCGTDCSCSSSSSNDDSTSSSSDDSTSSEGKKAAKKERKIERKRLKSEPDSKALSETIDVVATDKLILNEDPDTIIFESDLETDESETDEDFYDEHPQQLATQLLAEKRRQLMLQTCMNPMNNAIVENSRPSTPSLPEEIVKEKRVKVKKKKKDRKNVKNQILVPPLKLNIPIIPIQIKDLTQSQPNFSSSPNTIVSPITLRLPSLSEYTKISTPPLLNQQPLPSSFTSITSPHTPAQITNSKLRLSTGSSSETDSNIKRSKRRRIPNRFYGYSSDEDNNSTANVSGSSIGGIGGGMMKPTPPPNLTWCKEDLPTPITVRTPPTSSTTIKTPLISGSYNKSLQKQQHKLKKSKISSKITSSVNSHQKQKSKKLTSTKNTVATNYLPPIPPVIIRPPRVEPLRVPSVPVHHITPPIIYNYDSEKSSESSDTDSSSEGSLQISQNLPPIKTKIILPLEHQQQQQPQPQQQNQQQQQLQQQNIIGARIHSQSRLFTNNQNIRYPFTPPVGCRQAKEGEKVYCYCQCPYDEVSEMIACDGDNCTIEWFHFECVGIYLPPKGKWYCPDCRPKYFSGNNEYLDGDNI